MVLPMRVLLAEDDSAIAAALGAALGEQSHSVDHLRDGRLADIALHDHDYDLLVLDLGLPSLDGTEVLRNLRSRHSDMSVLVVTARADLDERIRILDFGADDFLVKPFALAEFAARVRALQRRRASHGAPELSIGNLRLDLPGRRVRNGDQNMELTAREFALLEALATRADKLVSRSQLVEAMCNWEQDLTDNGLDIAVHRLRRKLQSSGTRIRTVRGLGYLLEEFSEMDAHA